MTIVLDASVLIDCARGVPDAISFLLGQRALPVCSEVTRIEVLRGMREHERVPTERLFAAVEWAPVDEEIARRAGEMGRRWARSHPGLAVADLVVAATAERLAVAVATSNVRHFPMFKGLRAPY
jgi:predicted nucleic acid-binding protein